MLYLKRKSDGESGYFVKKRNSHKNSYRRSCKSMGVILLEVRLQKLRSASAIYILMN